MTQAIYMTRSDDIGCVPYDSIRWCHDQHLHTPDSQEFNFAVLYGNEDSPVMIGFWRDKPDYDTPPDYLWHAEGR